MSSHVTYSKETAAVIDAEINKIITTALEKARKMLAENKTILDNMARLLVERETIFSEEVDMLMDGKPIEEIEAFMDENEKRLLENPFLRKKGVIIEEPKKNKEEPVKTDKNDKEETDTEK